MVPKSSAMWKQLFFDFLLILGPFWEPKSIYFGTQIRPKSDLGAILGAKMVPKLSQMRFKGPPRRSQEGQQMKATFPGRPGPPRTPIFRLWRRRRGPARSQISAKSGPKMHPKIDDFFDPFFDRFWSPKLIKKRPPK